MQLPTNIQLEPVGQCNLRCQMCSIQFRQDGPPYGPPAFMDFEQFTRIIDQFTGLKELHLQGLGEPMMHPRFFDMVTYAADRGMPCCMVSTPDRINFGKIVEQGAEQTWNGEAYQSFRDQLASNEPPEICRSCSVYNGTF